MSLSLCEPEDLLTSRHSLRKENICFPSSFSERLECDPGMDLFATNLSREVIQVVQDHGGVIVRDRSACATTLPDLRKFGEKRASPEGSS
jgi:hypothetical protein